MRKKVIESVDERFGLDRRIVMRAEMVDRAAAYPDGIRFALQYLLMRGGMWLQIVRIDNHLHQGRPGTHIHSVGRKEVRWVSMTYNEAKKAIFEMGEGIIRRIDGED